MERPDRPQHGGGGGVTEEVLLTAGGGPMERTKPPLDPYNTVSVVNADCKLCKIIHLCAPPPNLDVWSSNRGSFSSSPSSAFALLCRSHTTPTCRCTCYWRRWAATTSPWPRTSRSSWSPVRRTTPPTTLACCCPPRARSASPLLSSPFFSSPPSLLSLSLLLPLFSPFLHPPPHSPTTSPSSEQHSAHPHPGCRHGVLRAGLSIFVCVWCAKDIKDRATAKGK